MEKNRKIKLEVHREEAENLIIALGNYLIKATEEELEDVQAPYSYFSTRCRILRMLYINLAEKLKSVHGIDYLHDEIQILWRGIPVSYKTINDLTSKHPKHHIAETHPIFVEIANFIKRARQAESDTIRSFYQKDYSKRKEGRELCNSV